MKKYLTLGVVAVVFSLLMVPLSAAAVPQARVETLNIDSVSDATAVSVLPAGVQQQLLPVLKAHPDLVSSFERSSVQSLVKPGGASSSLLVKLWNIVLYYRVCRFLFSLGIYNEFPNKLTMVRAVTWGIKILTWVKIGILLGIVEPYTPPESPQISFVANNEARTITVAAVNSTVIWENIVQVGNGTCDPFPTGNVTAGQMITNCSGNITLQYLPTQEILFWYDFT
jgi:hypothetical protein